MTAVGVGAPAGAGAATVVGTAAVAIGMVAAGMVEAVAAIVVWEAVMRIIAKSLSIILALVLSGCAVNESYFSISDVNKGCGKAMDVRAGQHWWNRFWTTPHRMVVYRKETGELQVEVETAPSSELSGLLGAASSVGGAALLMAPNPNRRLGGSTPPQISCFGPQNR